MELTVFGATGSVGREVVSQALDAGHSVTVLVRDPARLGELADRVTVIQGDVRDADAVDRAVASSQAVLNTLGHTNDSAADVLTVATTNTIKAMRAHGVQRLVVLSNTSISDADDHPTMGQKVQRALMNRAIGAINKDHAAQVLVIADSGLDWIIVRAATLADGPRTGKYKVGKLDRDAGKQITRADVAHFMLSSLHSDTHVRSKPVVSQ